MHHSLHERRNVKNVNIVPEPKHCCFCLQEGVSCFVSLSLYMESLIVCAFNYMQVPWEDVAELSTVCS